MISLSTWTWSLTDVVYKLSYSTLDRASYRHPSREIQEFTSLCSSFIVVYACQKLSQSQKFWQSYSKNKSVQFSATQCRRCYPEDLKQCNDLARLLLLVFANKPRMAVGSCSVHHALFVPATPISEACRLPTEIIRLSWRRNIARPGSVCLSVEKWTSTRQPAGQRERCIYIDGRPMLDSWQINISLTRRESAAQPLAPPTGADI